MKCKLLTLSSWARRLSFTYLFIVLSVIGSHFTYAQTAEVDSLRIALSSTTSDSERIVLMIELSNQFKNIDFSQSLTFAQKALDLSQQTGNKKQEAKALFTMGVLVYNTPKRASSITYFQVGEAIAEELGLLELQANHLMKIAKWHRYVSHDSTKTVEHLLKSVLVSKAANYNYGTGRSYAKLASFYTKYNEVDLIEKYLQLSADYYLQIENGNEEIAHYYDEVGNKMWGYNPQKSMDFFLKGMEYLETYPNIKVSLAKAYLAIGEPESALKHLKPAIAKLHEMRYYGMLGIALALQAEVCVELGDFKGANKACDEGITLLNPLGRNDQRALPAIYRTKGLVMELQGDDKAALKYFTKSIDEGNRIVALFELVRSNLVMGNFYLLRDDPQKGKIYCEKALNSAQKNDFTNLEIQACDCLYNIYKEEKAYASALKYQEQKAVLSDSISTLKVEHALDINSKIAQKNQQITEQAYQKEIKDEQLKNQKTLNNLLFISSFLGLLLIGFLTKSIRKISKQNKEISEQNTEITKKTQELQSANLNLGRSNEEITKKTQELQSANLSLARSNEDLERFAYIASHDLKSPLNTIISFTKLLRGKLGEELTPSVNESLHFIENSGKRMRQLIADILEYSKLSNQVTNENEQEVVNLNELVKEISQLIIDNPEGKLVSIEASNLPNIRWNHSKLFLLFKNLIENGLKYNKSEQPTIKLSFTKKKGINLISIEDNGIGIKKENFDKVFVMFRRLHSQSQYDGTGLGLATCKKIVDEFEGEISISSEIGKGTTFKIELPNHLIYEYTDMVM